MAADNNALEDFYSVLREGLSVGDLTDRYHRVFEFIHGAGLTENLRLAKEPAKKLRDEVMPMIAFLASHASEDDFIQFPLDDGPFDCDLRQQSGRQRKIQITGGQRLERLYVMRQLNQKGEAHAFVGLGDGEPKQKFAEAIKRPEAYTTEQAQELILKAVQRCLERKKEDVASDTLVIDLPLGHLSEDHWREFLPVLTKEAAGSQFAEVFIVSCDEEKLCFQIK